MIQDLEIAYIQTDILWENVDENLQRYTEMIHSIKRNVDLIVFPETFSTGFSPNCKKLAEQENGKTMQWMLSIAKTKNAIVAGSVYILQTDNEVTNRFIWMKPDGTFEYYDKKHLFVLSKEAQDLKKGTELKTFILKGWKIRSFICYDVRFPCWNRNSYIQEEFAYDLAIFIASWPIQRAKAWNSLLPARAIENQAYVLGLNRIGTDELSDVHIGDSAMYDFLGNKISEVPQSTETIGFVELNYEKLQSFRQGFKVSKDWDKFAIFQ